MSITFRRLEVFVAAARDGNFRRTAERLGISRTPVREAFRELVQMQLLVSEPYKGVRVAQVDLASIRIGNEKIDFTRTYSVTVNTGVIMLLPLMGVQVSNIQIRPELEYTALKQYVQDLGVVQYKSEGRIKDATLLD